MLLGVVNFGTCTNVSRVSGTVVFPFRQENNVMSKGSKKKKLMRNDSMSILPKNN